MSGSSWYRALILRVGRRSRKTFNRWIARWSRIGDPAVFAVDEFPWMRELEAHWREIRAEAESVLAWRRHLPVIQRISPDHARIARDEDWKTFFLYGYAVRSDVGLTRCPVTARLLAGVPGLETALFSILSPHAHLPRHTGVTKALVTCHLALQVPPGSGCRITVDDQDYQWQEGHGFIFDDTRHHEVRNDTEAERVVLLIHVRRPVRFPGNLAAWLFLTGVKLSPFIRDGKRNLRAWEREFEKAAAR